MILAVATVWGITKGFDDLIYLNSLLPDKSVIVVVGVTTKQIKKLPGNMIGIERTENTSQLVEIYSAADIFINPTYQDTLPTVNIESVILARNFSVKITNFVLTGEKYPWSKWP